jgi:hypothetical protein
VRWVAGTAGGRLTGARLTAARGVTVDDGDAAAPAMDARVRGRDILTGAGRVGRPADRARGADGADMADGPDGVGAEGRAEGAGDGATVAPAPGRSTGGLTEVEAASATGGRTTSEGAGASLGWERGGGITTGGASVAGRLRSRPARRRASERLGGDIGEAGVVTG